MAPNSQNKISNKREPQKEQPSFGTQNLTLSPTLFDLDPRAKLLVHSKGRKLNAITRQIGKFFGIKKFAAFHHPQIIRPRRRCAVVGMVYYPGSPAS
ncbi:MAG: hypothetical protein CM15mP46_4540 [Alphaproteobacteria bacterium]|nr:MAG: hypothetical protein CM15mP46_4540 [Alphaproteobacteria bacterium]